MNLALWIGVELLILVLLAYMTRYTKLAGWLMLLGLAFITLGVSLV